MANFDKLMVVFFSYKSKTVVMNVSFYAIVIVVDDVAVVVF